MSERRLRRLAWTLFAVEVAMFGAAAWFSLLETDSGSGDWGTGLAGELAFAVAFVLMFPVVGLLLATRLPRNALGWLMLGIGFFATEPLSAYGAHALAVHGAGADWALAADAWSWVPVIGLAGSFVLLLFPDGHLPSPRWRWFAWTVVIGMVLTSIAILFAPGSLADSGYPDIQNPFGIEALKPVLGVMLVALATIPLGILGSALSLVLRYRRSGPTERLQIRWLASTAVVVAVLYAAAMLGSLLNPDPGWLPALQNLALLSFGLLPISIGVAVLRHRLYDINVVIRKAVVVGAIAVFFTAVYASIVGGIGALVQSRATTTLSFIAAAVVATLFQPVLGNARRIADRVVYGRRATPYEVLAEFSDRVAETYADDDVLPRMARVVGEGIGALRADVWLMVDDQLRVSASWPADAERPPPVKFGGEGLPRLPSADAAFPVEHQGVLLGALAVAMPASDPMDEAKAKLVADLASQAGLVLRNVRLAEDLRARFEDLKAAQKRIVAAQDDARRRLERNIHDGAQQQLVALAVRLRLAQGLVAKDPSRAESMLGDLQTETQRALEDLRDLAHGIYPPLLADKGIVAALESQARKAAVAVQVTAASGVGRYLQEAEAAAYFCSLEALQNVAKYANVTHAEIRLDGNEGMLTFEVADDGVGFDPATTTFGSGLQGMADRLAALDGTLEVRSAPGGGTVVVGRIPVTPSEATETGAGLDRTTAGV
jgi:signal transduction histidine kinase